jgi:Protein of unknown function (Hypoth_ymh)
VEASKNPDYLRSVAKAVADFRDALNEFLELHVVNESFARGVMPAVLPKDKAKPQEIARLHGLVAQAAGRASAAPGLTGMYIAVQGAGAIDPIAAWSTMTKPKPLLESDDVLSACDQMIGRLDALVLKAEAEAPPTIGAAAMHPLIWGAAAPLWRDRHFRQAVGAAAEALIASVKVRTGRNDVAETDLWKQVLSSEPPAPGKPRLRWPGDPNDRNVKSMSDGLRQYAPGVQMTIRNMMIHVHEELSEQPALERLAALSLLATWIDNCDLVEAAT